MVERRLINKTIWGMRHEERRKRAVEMVACAVESRRASGGLLSGSSTHLNWINLSALGLLLLME